MIVYIIFFVFAFPKSRWEAEHKFEERSISIGCVMRMAGIYPFRLLALAQIRGALWVNLIPTKFDMD